MQTRLYPVIKTYTDVVCKYKCHSILIKCVINNVIIQIYNGTSKITLQKVMLLHDIGTTCMSELEAPVISVIFFVFT